MLRKILFQIGFLPFVIGFVNQAYSQVNQWTWMNGDNVPGIPGVYGTKGIASATNFPGSRRFSVSWTDSSGNFWLFGGNGYDANGDAGYLNDLWKFNPSANQWTWINGDNVVDKEGQYGTKGVPSASNKPGGRRRSTSWTDKDNHLWIFGGNGYDAIGQATYLNDLWRYDIANNQWTWMKGDSLGEAFGTYGTQGISAMNNQPGARYGAMSWIDLSGKLFVFGGRGNAASQTGELNDLWVYEKASNQWTWMKGSDVPDVNGVYGSKGVGAVGNTPGGRTYGITWNEPSNEFWLFGGGYHNDLWKYSVLTNQWTWVNGSMTTNNAGVYGTQGIAAINNSPGGREFGNGWKDAQGNLWLFGGSGVGAADFGYLNDLWTYNVSTNQWTWMKGSNGVDVPGAYGTKGAAAVANNPGARQYAVNWKDKDGSFWLFGGDGYYAPGESGYLNDLWKYNPQIYSSLTSGNWNDPSIWADGVVPPANAVVIIRHTVTVTANTSCFSLKIEQPGQVIVNAGIQLTIIH